MGLDGCPPSQSLGTTPCTSRVDRGECSPGVGRAAAQHSRARTALALWVCGAGTDLLQQWQAEPCGCWFPSLVGSATAMLGERRGHLRMAGLQGTVGTWQWRTLLKASASCHSIPCFLCPLLAALCWGDDHCRGAGPMLIVLGRAGTSQCKGLSYSSIAWDQRCSTIPMSGERGRSWAERGSRDVS